VKILNLSIKNFMAVGEAALPLNDKGLILIQGNNEDDSSQASNGAGKSTVAEALCWAFYGETARGETGDAVVNRTEKKGTQVVVELLDEAGAVYRVSRYRKDKAYKNMLRLEIQEGESWKDLTKGTDKLTQEVVNKVIGCTHEVFASAIYAGQEAMPDLPGMTDKQLKLLVEEAAGINGLQAAFEAAKTKHSDAKNALAEISGKIASARAAITTLDDQLETAEKNRDAFEAKRKLDVEAKTIELRDISGSIDPAMEGKIESKLVEIASQILDLQGQIASVGEEKKKEADLRRDAHNTSSAVITAKRDYDRALADAQKAKHAFEHADAKVGSPCGECGHVIEATDVAGAKDAAKKVALEKAHEAKRLRAELEDAEKRAGLASDALSAFVATMTDVSATVAEIEALSAKRTKLQTALRNEQDKKARLARAQAECKQIEEQENPYLKMLSHVRESIDKAEKNLEALEAHQETAQIKADVAAEAVRVFGPAGVRAHILDTVTPYLNSRTSHYLSALTDGNITAVWSTISTTSKGELREKFSIDVVSATGAESFKGLSGGEKRKVRLACAMALQDLVSSRASKPIKIFIADEIDHALDPAGLERLMTILEEKSHDKGTVLVISHSDLRDWIRNSITITKKGGKSYLESVCL
jgi:DNA repair exonuclease SbcCD ATPase subunit